MVPLRDFHPPSQNDKYYFENISKVIDLYNGLYDKMLLVGADEGEMCLIPFFMSIVLKILSNKNMLQKSK